MNKLFSMVMMLAMVLAITPMDAQAQASKGDVKAAKTRAKDLKKQKWEYVGGSTLENDLIKLANKENQGYETVIGEGNNCKTPSVAKLKAAQDAAIQLAQTGKSIIKGRIASKIDDINGEEADNIASGFERLMVKELEGVFTTPAITLRRTNSEGKTDYQCYYSVPSSIIQNARKKALEGAIEEAGLSRQYANSISDFINDGFENL